MEMDNPNPNQNDVEGKDGETSWREPKKFKCKLIGEAIQIANPSSGNRFDQGIRSDNTAKGINLG